VGVRCKDGIVLGFEKLIVSKMLVEGSSRRIMTVGGNPPRLLTHPPCPFHFSSSSSLTSNLLKSDQLLTTHRSPSTVNQDPLQTS